METLDGFYFDIETDGLYLQSSKIWYAKFKSLDGKRELALFPHKDKDAANKLMQWVSQYTDGCYVVSHNGLGFDLWGLWKLLGIKPVVGKAGKDYLGGKHVTFIDTYVLSMYINPDSKGHSLEFLASGNENEKMDFRQKLIDQGLMDKAAPKGHEFSFFSDVMIDYCDADVEAGIGVFNKLWADAKALYKDWVHPSFRQLSKDYFLYSAQAYTGVKFNVEKAKALLEHIDEKMAEIKAIVDPMLPSRELKSTEQAFYKIPAAPYKKNGDLSSTMIKWLEKHNAKIVDGKIEAYGMKVDIVANAVLPIKMPMEIDDNIELKDYFIKSGWQPHEDFWNLKKDPVTGKPMRDEKGKVIKTTPKIQNAGQLCPNLLKLNGEIPSKVVKYLSYRNRRGVVQGWLDNWRIQWDGRLSAEISGYTPTYRVKHKTVVNCPKADPKVLLGSEMRDLFTVDDGYWYIGTDASALENRTVAAYTMKYDGGAFADIVLNGDSHCYSEDTEILTENGWKCFGELFPNEKVAQYDRNGVISFVQPSHIVWQDYEGDMVRFKSGTVSLLVTPDHRMCYNTVRSNQLQVALAKDLIVGKSSQRIPVAGETDSDGVDLTDSEISFLVAVQADAHLLKNTATIEFCFVKTRKIERIEYLLKDLKYHYSVRTYNRNGKDEYKFLVSDSRAKKLVANYLSDKKAFTSKFLDMSIHQCKIFLDEIAEWDGTVRQNGDVVFDTTCKISRDIASAVATLSNVRSYCNEYYRKTPYGEGWYYRLYISKNCMKKPAVSLLSVEKAVEHYKGKIGCVSVPSTFIIVRKDSKVIVSGNTRNAFIFFPELKDKFDPDTEGLKDLPEFKPYRNKAKTGM